MTILVTPIKPFRAWQYRKGKPAPEWVRIESPFAEPGDWFVESEWGFWRFTPAEFQERFRVET
jgi:hypothetical protein